MPNNLPEGHIPGITRINAWSSWISSDSNTMWHFLIFQAQARLVVQLTPEYRRQNIQDTTNLTIKTRTTTPVIWNLRENSDSPDLGRIYNGVL